MTYETNKHKIITSPGKFEGEMYYVPELWELCMISGEDLIYYDDDIPISIFKIDDDLISKYSELDGYFVVALWETEQGFVYSDLISRDNLDEYVQDFREQLEDL